MKRILLFLVVLISLLRCSSRNNQQTSSNDLTYQAELIHSTGEPFEIKEAHCKPDSNRIIITAEVYNSITDSIQLSVADWELETEMGLRSPVIDSNNPLFKIGPKATSPFELIFEPVNSLKLFRETGLKGNLLRNYKLTYKGKGILDIRASEENYASYLKDKKEPDVFYFSPHNDFKNNELSYLQSNLALQATGMEIHEQEILVNGLNLVLNAYTFRDTLYVKLKLVNHSLFPVSISPGAMTVLVDNNSLVSTAPHQATSTTIPRSQRGYVEERYPIGKSSAAEFELNVTSITFMATKPVSVFYAPTISMKRSSSGI